MSSHTVDVNSQIDAIATRSLPGSVKAGGAIAMGLGVIGLAYGFAVAGAAWTWGAILVALVYLLALTQGGIVYAVIIRVHL